jgi:hypothetical protein
VQRRAPYAHPYSHSIGVPEHGVPDRGIAAGQSLLVWVQCHVGLASQTGPIGPGRQFVHSHVVPGGHVHHASFSVQAAPLAAVNVAGQLVAFVEGQPVGEASRRHCPCWHRA